MKKLSIIASAMVLCLVGALFAAGCAPKANEGADARGKAEPEVIQVDFTWSPDADCTTCHAAEAGSLSTISCVSGVDAHEGAACTTCHVDNDALGDAHEGATADAKMPQRLKKTKVEQQACLACHESKEALAERTIGSTAVVDERGTTANPHALSSCPEHDALICADCHDPHSAEPIAETAHAECVSCHHQDVFECYTCHEER